MKNIATDLDAMNRFEAGEIELSFEKFNIDHQIKGILELLDLEAKKNWHLLDFRNIISQYLGFCG